MPIFFLSCDSLTHAKAAANEISFTTFFGWHFNFLWVLLICIFICCVCNINYEYKGTFKEKIEKGKRLRGKDCDRGRKGKFCNPRELQKYERKRTNLKVVAAAALMFKTLYACPRNMLYTLWIKNCSTILSILYCYLLASIVTKTKCTVGSKNSFEIP